MITKRKKSFFWHAIWADFAIILGKLRRTPLLWGWLLLSAVLTLGIWRWTGLVTMLVNFLLLGLYVLIIRYFTPQPAPALLIRKPGLELSVALAWFGLSMLFTFSFHRMLNLGWLSWWQLQGIPQATQTFIQDRHWPTWTANEALNAAMNFPFQLMPVVLLFVFLGYRLRGMGLIWRKGYGWLIGVLLLLNVLLGLPFHQQIFGEQSAWQVLVLFSIGIFINALPEELFYRGFLLPRLEPFTGSLNAVVISAWLFNASHIPSYMVQDGSSLWLAVLTSFSLVFPSGLAWGYLYYRTRSVLPGILWHGATSVLGLTFIGF